MCNAVRTCVCRGWSLLTLVLNLETCLQLPHMLMCHMTMRHGCVCVCWAPVSAAYGSSARWLHSALLPQQCGDDRHTLNMFSITPWQRYWPGCCKHMSAAMQAPCQHPCRAGSEGHTVCVSGQTWRRPGNSLRLRQYSSMHGSTPTTIGFRGLGFTFNPEPFQP